MSWAVGFDSTWNRDIGYGVPATCDHPGCGAAIDRGIRYVCGGVFGENGGCGLHFCLKHGGGTLCERCEQNKTGDSPFNPFDPTPDTIEWVRHKLTHESWAKWREEHPEEVRVMNLTCVSVPQPTTPTR